MPEKVAVTSQIAFDVADEHDPEGATIAFERSQIGAFVRQTEHHLEEIEAALKRLDAGTYETCEGCGGPIGEGRLEARPVARTCIQCAASTQRCLGWLTSVVRRRLGP